MLGVKYTFLMSHLDVSYSIRVSTIIGRKSNSKNAKDQIKNEDSMFVGKIAIGDSIVLIKCDDPNPSTHIVQLNFCVLAMFQSTENHDASGKQVFHVSLNNFWLCTHNKFTPRRQLESTNDSILSPLAAELRAVYLTVNYGDVMSKEYCLDCDSIEVCLQNVQLQFITQLISAYFELFRDLGLKQEPSLKSHSLDSMGSRKIQGVATSVTFQFQPWSFVLLRSGKQPNIAPLLKLEGSAVGAAEGCLCREEEAMLISGEVKNEFTLWFFSDILYDWIYLIERTSMSIGVEYEPTDLVRIYSCIFENHLT